MANTTNFGWETPDDTDLVKDGAAAMRTLGNSIDSSFVDLKGGTTGQILSKNSNTDLDYIWINNDQGDITAVTAGTGISGGGTSGAVTITNSMATEITASGDIIVGTGSGTFDNLPIGTTGQVLTADTAVSPYKVKWAAASTGKIVQVVSATSTTGTGTTSNSWVSSGFTISITPASTSNKVLILGQIPLQFAGGSSVSGSMSLFRGTVSGTNLGDATWGFGGIGAAGEQNINSIAYLDSPNTTSSQTYTLAIRANSGVNTVFANNGALGSMIAIEVAP